ncbi:MAG TPA: hypothetical protein H9693_03655 [Firmicutes bacterium]|nr:hypothetical protein [Bacillota bacterium]
MSDEKITTEKISTNDVADSLIDLCENMGICDRETSIGFKKSKKKDILKSKNDQSFSKFTNEVKKRQEKK